MKNIGLIVIALFATSMSFTQSAWTKPKGNIFTQISLNDISNYSRIFNKNGEDLYTSRNITDRTLQSYIEYGLSNKTTLSISIPYKLLKSGDLVPKNSNLVTIEKGSYNSFGNIGLAIRHQLANKKYVIASQFQIDLPTSSFDKNTGLRSGIDALTISPTIAIGKGNETLFFQSFISLFFRTNQYSHGLKFYIEGGKKIFNQLWIIAFIDIVDSFENGNVISPLQNLETFLNLNNSEYGGFGIKLIEELNSKFGITGAFGGAFSAHLEAQKPSFNLGVYYKFKKEKS